MRYYEVSGVTNDGCPFVMTPCDERWMAEDVAKLLREDGCTDIVILVRNVSKG